MEKYHKKLFYTGCILSLLPIYHFFSWIHTFEKYIEISSLEIIPAFLENAFLGIFPTYLALNITLSLIGLLSGILLGMSMMASFNNPNFGMKYIKVIVFIINVLFTFWVLWGLM